MGLVFLWAGKVFHLAVAVRQLAVLSLLAAAVFGQDTDKSTLRPEEKRMFGLLPNNKSVPAGAVVEPLPPRKKFELAARDSFDPMVPIVVSINAGWSHLSNQYPSLGQGAKGFGERWIRAGADTVVSNFMTEGIVPTLTHQDPRYFRRGSQYSASSRTLYALSRIFRIRGDDGKNHFNYSELVGNAAVVSIGGLYYPSEDRKLGPLLSRFGFQVGTDAAFNVVKEFWPEMHDKFLTRHKASEKKQ